MSFGAAGWGRRVMTICPQNSVGRFKFFSILFPACVLFLKAHTPMTKTKKIAGHFDLPSSSFAYVGDVEDTSTWKLPIFAPGNMPLSRNLLKSALFRFADTKDIQMLNGKPWH